MTTTIVTAELPAGSLDALHDAGHDVVQLDDDRRLADVVDSAEAVICVVTDRVDRAVLQRGAAGLHGATLGVVGWSRLGRATVAMRTAMARTAAASVLAVLDGHRPRNLVTDPRSRS